MRRLRDYMRDYGGITPHYAHVDNELGNQMAMKRQAGSHTYPQCGLVGFRTRHLAAHGLTALPPQPGDFPALACLFGRRRKDV